MIRITLVTFLISISVLSLAQDEFDSYDVFLIVGQSNTLHGCCQDPNISKDDPLIKQLGRFEQDSMIIPAKEPLMHHHTGLDWTSFAMTFARLYENEFLEEGRKILLIPCGRGGSGFVNKMWNPGDFYYEDAVMRTNYVLSRFPNAKLKAIFWQQGEKDASENNKDYKEDLDRMIKAMRSDIVAAGDETPWIMGGMVPFWVDQKKKREEFQNIIANTVNRHPNTFYVSPYDPFVIKKEDNEKDEIHYDYKGQLELGQRYFDVYSKVVKDK